VDQVPSLEGWLAETSYTRQRKEEIQKALSRKPKNIRKNQSFIKDEAYDTEKYARAINSYDDYVKAFTGPFIHCVEKRFFSSLPKFVKGKTNSERDRMLIDRFAGTRVVCTDFSSMEAHHTGAFADLFCDFIRSVGRFTDPDVIECVVDLVLGVNICDFGDVVAKIPQRLMSGAMWTSLQNSFLNLFLISYLYEESDGGKDWLDLRVLVEGDDGICEYFPVKMDVIERLGLKLKMEIHDNFATASFCGRVIGHRGCAADITKTLCKLMWFPMRYWGRKHSFLLSLLKARATSYLMQYKHAPVVAPICYAVLTALAWVDVRVGQAELEKDWCYEAACLVGDEQVVDESLRVIVERVYGVSVGLQLEMERMIQPGLVFYLPGVWPSHLIINLYDNLFTS
jgi:hypothetical protein